MLKVLKNPILAGLFAVFACNANAHIVLGQVPEPSPGTGLVDIQLESRGRVLPVYYGMDRGARKAFVGVDDYLVRNEEPYAIRITNNSDRRVKVVTSVDGVNIIDGSTASVQGVGYVLNPHESARYSGWRKTDAEVAQFYFSKSEDSYAARTGREANTGVIGVAVYPEKDPDPVSVPYNSITNKIRGASADPSIVSAPAAAPAPALPGAGSVEKSESIGTGHGARQVERSYRVEFKTRSNTPDEVQVLTYKSVSTLVRMGVIRPSLPANPNPFPSDSRYTPDPPLYRR